VDAVRLDERCLNHGGEVQEMKPPDHRTRPAPLDPLLEDQTAVVRREGRTFYVLAEHCCLARGQVSFDQIRPSARAERSVEAVAVAGERDSPEVEIRRLEARSVAPDRELLEIAERGAAGHVDQSRLRR